MVIVADFLTVSNIVSGTVVKLVGKLADGTVFVKKGHDDEEPLEFKTDEG